MLDKLKSKLKKAKNNGSSFVLVIVSTTFLAVLVSALIMGMLLAYKLRYYRLNSLNNFYSVEQAMDEIYAGIGASVNEHLYSAYTNTAELVVYYDGSTYTNMDDDEANAIFKKIFMQGIYDDTSISRVGTLCDTLQEYITDDKVTLVCDDIRIVLEDANGNTVYSKWQSAGTSVDGSTILNGGSEFSSNPDFDYTDIATVTLKNICVKRSITLTTADDYTTAPGTYEQSITTDIVLTQPEYNVSFDLASSSSDSLYSYALLADMGLEVFGETTTTTVNITGNVYTASDYYNKDYNDEDFDDKNFTQVTDVYSSLDRLATTNSSIYSGIYVQGAYAKLNLLSDVVICSGSLAAFDGATIGVQTLSTGTVTELWTDNIIIGGDEGGSISLKANAYVYDDTELNADSASLKVYSGSRYFGYSYSSTDTRSFDYVQNYAGKSFLPTYFSPRSHFGDSAIIVNGQDSSLDLADASSLYIAGKSYIEFSKVAASTTESISSEKLEDYGIVSGDEYVYTSVTDYATGFSLDVKSNQLIFLMNWSVDKTSYETDTTTNVKTVHLYVDSDIETDSDYYNLYKDFIQESENGDFVYAIVQTTVSGTEYYYLMFSSTDDSADFARKYYKLFTSGYVAPETLYNVANYDDFEVTLLLPDAEKINSAAAVTNQSKTSSSASSLYVEAEADTTLNVETALYSASTNKVFTNLLGNLETTASNLLYESIKVSANDSSVIESTSTTEEQISNFLEYMYINMKDHLSVLDKEDEDGNTTTAWEIVNKGKTTENYSLTPLNYYINYEYVLGLTSNIDIKLDDFRIVVTNDETTTIGFTKGIVISSGNVEFSSDVTSFTGMIICGGKLTCDHSVSITASATSVASALQECAESETDTDKNAVVTQVLKNFEMAETSTEDGTTGLSISDISYVDILAFQNWKKNVDSTS